MSTVQSPLPGVFYRKPSPDADPFVEEGSEVSAGQVIGLIEVMKNFSELKADAAGTLASFLVEDAAEVEVGQGIAEIS
ncbi:MAG: acetyl-CoA carboxylase [Nocardioidaceae bacterium]